MAMAVEPARRVPTVRSCPNTAAGIAWSGHSALAMIPQEVFMRRTVRPLAVAVSLVSVAALSMVASGGAPAVAAPQDRAAQTITLVATRSVFSVPGTPSVGASFIGGGELTDTSGAHLGQGYSTCSIAAVEVSVPPSFTALCTSVYRLPDGQLHLSSLRSYDPLGAGFGSTDVAVTGGTGAYATARGSGTATRVGTSPVSYRFTLNVVTDS